MSKDGSGSPGGLQLSWRLIALVSTAFAFSSTAALAVFLTRDNVSGVDLLSIVAFVVAILSFIFQLVIAIAQNVTANQQFVNTAQVNSESQRALAEIRALTGEMQRRRDDQFESVLNHVLPSAVSEAVGANPDNEALAELITGRLNMALREGMQELSTSPLAPYGSFTERARLWARARAWIYDRGFGTDENIARAIRYFDNLDAQEVARLQEEIGDFDETMRTIVRTVPQAHPGRSMHDGQGRDLFSPHPA